MTILDLERKEKRRIQIKMTNYGIRISTHFLLSEFLCGCKGKYAACPRSVVHAALPAALEVYRTHFITNINGLIIGSGFRCVQHNIDVGGAHDSQHVMGTAVDIPGMATQSEVRALGVFSGIGTIKNTGLVVHVDVRHLGPYNTTKSSPESPALWYY